jgi:hypothetical protein
VAFISLSTAGYILMVAGLVVFFVGLALALRGRRVVATSRSDAGVRQDSVRRSDTTEL